MEYYVITNECTIDPLINPNRVYLQEHYPDLDVHELPSDYNYNGNYIIVDGELVKNPDYEKEQKKKEKERVNNLTMTALDFIGVLEHFGLDYATQIKPFLESHQDLDKQLKYCQNVWCRVAKQVFAEPIEIGDITITSEMVEQAFKDKTGENDENKKNNCKN